MLIVLCFIYLPSMCIASILPASELSSPRIGARSNVSFLVPLEVANGRIKFATQSVTVAVMEPEMNLIAPVNLIVTRGGFSGNATVFWRVTSSNADFNVSTDIVGTAGQIVIPSG